MSIDGSTGIYGVIGNPVSHSLSPPMHNAAFAHLGENRVYVPFQTDDLETAVAGLRALGVAGLSVTIPFKERILDLLDEIDPTAAKIGAVNTVVFGDEASGRRLFGMNTDWLGANRALAEAVDPAGARAVILGAGGAARAVGFGLLQAGAQVEIRSRSEAAGRALADDLGAGWAPLGGGAGLEADILVNATSVGMAPDHEASPVAAGLLAGCRVVMDIVYVPQETRLLKDAAAAGCVCIDGLQMLLYQGVAQFERWTGLAAPVEVMDRALRGAAGRAARGGAGGGGTR